MHNSQFSILKLCIVAGAVGLSVGACTSPPTPTPGPDPTEFLSTRVAEILTANAATLKVVTLPPASTPTPTILFTHTPSPTPSSKPSLTPTPGETSTLTPTSRATEQLSSFPAPPPTFGGDSHFYLGSPIQADIPAFIASAYRYGSTGVGQLFAPHHGADYSAGAGVELVAVAPGTVYYAGNDAETLFGPQTNFYGNLVLIQLFDMWAGHTVYALTGHMDEVRVQTGQVVNAGEVIGTVGATGVALGPHPHLEVRLDFPESYWDTRNPELWLQPPSGAGVIAIRVTNALGQYLPGVRVKLLCADGAPRTLETYWYNGVNPDDAYGENAATQAPAGYCSAEASLPEGDVSDATTIPAGGIGFIWLKP